MRKLGYFVSGLLCAGSLSANPAADIFFTDPQTQHSYVWRGVSGLTWDEAAALAADEVHPETGMPGYLATLHRQSEVDFIDQVMFSTGRPDNTFIGGSDAEQEGYWRWITGPEGDEDGGSGLLFWIGGPDGTPQNNFDGPFTFPGGSDSADYLFIYSYMRPEFNPWNGSTGSPGAGGNQGYLVEFEPPQGSCDVYVVSDNSFAFDSDVVASVQQQYDLTADLAEWNDIKNEYGGSVQAITTFMNETGIQLSSNPATNNYFVKVSGQEFHSESRRYFVTRFNGSVPSSYLVHDEIQAGQLVLGSYNYESQALVRRVCDEGKLTAGEIFILLQSLRAVSDDADT